MAGTIFKVAHTNLSGQSYINESRNLGFNIIHTNDTRNQNENEVLAFCNRCWSVGAKAMPRVDLTNSRLTQIIQKIKGNAGLTGVVTNDELDIEHVSLADQKWYYNKVKSIAPKMYVYALYNSGNVAYQPRGSEFNQVCDVVIWGSYPYRVGENSGFKQALARQQARMEYIVNRMRGSSRCLLPIVQAFYGGVYRMPCVKWQRDLWANYLAGKRCRMGTAYWFAGRGSSYNGFMENAYLKNEVIKSLAKDNTEGNPNW